MPRALLIALTLIGLAPIGALAGETRLIAGAYDDLLIGFNPADHSVTGYFSSETGAGKFTCIFYLQGALQGVEAPISTYYPEDPAGDLIKGRLTLTEPQQLQIRLPTEHGGCWNVQHFADQSQPANFQLSKAYPWLAIAVVKAEKAYFFDTPGAASHRKGYVVQGDGLGVRSSRAGWLQVDFVGGAKPVSGWIKQDDVYPGR